MKGAARYLTAIVTALFALSLTWFGVKVHAARVQRESVLAGAPKYVPFCQIPELRRELQNTKIATKLTLFSIQPHGVLLIDHSCEDEKHLVLIAGGFSHIEDSLAQSGITQLREADAEVEGIFTSPSENTNMATAFWRKITGQPRQWFRGPQIEITRVSRLQPR